MACAGGDGVTADTGGNIMDVGKAERARRDGGPASCRRLAGGQRHGGPAVRPTAGRAGGLRGAAACVRLAGAARAGAAAVAAAVVGVLLAAFALAGCSAAAVVDDASPRCTGAVVEAGSQLTEESQYVEVRLAFDADLEADGDVAGDLDVLLNGEEPDSRTIAVEACVEGSEVVVRLVPTEAAAGGTSSSVYYALYDGLVSVAASAENGGLAHVHAAGGSSSAVLDEAVSLTVPTGIQVGGVESVTGDAAAGVCASVSFDVQQFAQLRCCAWFSFGDSLPTVMMHNHEFLRDTQKTCAERLAQTVNASCEGQLVAQADGARVTVSAVAAVDGQELSVSLIEGVGADPTQGESSGIAAAEWEDGYAVGADSGSEDGSADGADSGLGADGAADADASSDAAAADGEAGDAL